MQLKTDLMGDIINVYPDVRTIKTLMSDYKNLRKVKILLSMLGKLAKKGLGLNTIVLSLIEKIDTDLTTHDPYLLIKVNRVERSQLTSVNSYTDINSLFTVIK